MNTASKKKEITYLNEKDLADAIQLLEDIPKNIKPTFYIATPYGTVKVKNGIIEGGNIQSLKFLLESIINNL